jgi:hypothetical protein
MNIIKRIKKWLCLMCCCDDSPKNVKNENEGSHVTVDDASFVILESRNQEDENIRRYPDEYNCLSWFDVPENEPKSRTPLKRIEKGDAVVFYDRWKDKLNKGLYIVKSFDYGDGDMPGSAPRALYGRTYIDGTYYSSWVPGCSKFYSPTERELEDFFACEPMSDKLNSLYYFEKYPELMDKYRKYRFKE